MYEQLLGELVVKPLSNGHNICLNIFSTLLRHVERCWDRAVSNGLNILSTNELREVWDGEPDPARPRSPSCWANLVPRLFRTSLGTRLLRLRVFNKVERACQTASTFREQKKCWDDVETKFKRIQTLLNMSQHVSTMLRGGVKRPQHRLSTMLRECWDKCCDRLTGALDKL